MAVERGFPCALYGASVDAHCHTALHTALISFERCRTYIIRVELAEGHGGSELWWGFFCFECSKRLMGLVLLGY